MLDGCAKHAYIPLTIPVVWDPFEKIAVPLTKPKLRGSDDLFLLARFALWVHNAIGMV